MDREIFFVNNLKGTLAVLVNDNNLNYSTLKFKLTPIDEPNKPNNLGGDWLCRRHWSRRNPNFDRKDWSFKEVIDLLYFGSNFFPLWIHVSLNDDYIELIFSRRYRKYKDLHYYEYGYPPFKIINRNGNNT